MGLYIGIDGGGTHSTAAAVRPDGCVAALVSGGGMNYHHAGAETVRLRLAEMVRQLEKLTGERAEKVCVGMSALDGPADAETTAAFASGLPDGVRLDLQSDAYAALMGYTCGESGMIVICGTGSMLLLMDEAGRQHVGGGWGYLLEDAGSGYSLAREALLAVLREAEGIGPATGLTAPAMDFLGTDTPRGIVDRVYAPDFTPDRLAAFAPQVIELAEQGDGPAARIVRDNMERLACQAVRLFDRAPAEHRVGLYGGILTRSASAREAFEHALRQRMPDVRTGFPEYPPEIGAVIHLMRAEGRLSPDVLENMKTTMKEAALS